MTIHGRTIPFKDKEVNPDAVLDPSSAQFQMWLAQMKRDHGDMSSKELTKHEIAFGGQAKRARHCYNPFTGIYKKIPLSEF